MNDESAGGRIFFSSTGRSLVDEDEIVVLSVGPTACAGPSKQPDSGGIPVNFSRRTMEDEHEQLTRQALPEGTHSHLVNI